MARGSATPLPHALSGLTALLAIITLSSPLTVQSGDAILRGFLDLPSGHGPFPAVLIIPGAGPVNADGNMGAPGASVSIQHSPYLKIAQGLTTGGWAVARLNKRALLPSTGSPATSVVDYVDDAQRALTRLRETPTIDADRIAVLGHSQGGLIALMVATRESLRGLILAGTPGRPPRDVWLEQALNLARRRGATDEELDQVRKRQDDFDRVVRAYAGSGPMTYNGETYPEDAVRLLQSVIDLDPLAVARRVTVPVLILQGEDDFNVAPENGKLLVKALPRATLRMVPGMSHIFTAATDRDATQLRTTAGTVLHPEVIPALLEWLNRLGGHRR